MAELDAGAVGEAVMTVGEADVASRVAGEEGGEFPEVLATARLVALLETAAALAMRGVLGPGEMSVGVRLSIEHTAPTPVGARVVARAAYRGREGKLYAFDVSAADEAGEVGKGTHHRAVVLAERLIAGARRRSRG